MLSKGGPNLVFTELMTVYRANDQNTLGEVRWKLFIPKFISLKDVK